MAASSSPITDITALAAAEAAAESPRRDAAGGARQHAARHRCSTARTAGCWPPTRWPADQPAWRRSGCAARHAASTTCCAGSMRNGIFGAGAGGDATLRRLLGRRPRAAAAGACGTCPMAGSSRSFSDPTPDGGFVVTFTDITARARAEAEARQRAAMLQVTLDSMRHGIILFGPDRRLMAANRLAGPDYGLARAARPGAACCSRAGAAEQRGARHVRPEPRRPRRLRQRCSGSTAARPARYRRRTGGRPDDRGRLRPDAGWRLRRHPYRCDRAGPRRRTRPRPAPPCCS